MIPNPETLRTIVEAATRRLNGEPQEPQDAEVLTMPWETVLTLAEALLRVNAELDTTDELLAQFEVEAVRGNVPGFAGVAARRENIARVLLTTGGRA